MLGNILIFIGLVGLLAVGVGFVLTNPEKVRWLREYIQQSLSSVKQSQQEIRGLKHDLTVGTRVQSDAPVEDQFGDLQLNEMVEITPFQSLPKVDRTLQALGIFSTLNRVPRTSQFSPRGEDWTVRIFDDEAMLISRPEGYYWLPLNKRVALEPEAVKAFNAAGETFSGPPYSQEPLSYTFQWKGSAITVIDVGYFDVRVTGGDLLSRDGARVKYLLGQTKDGRIIFVQNHLVGTDYIFTGGTSLGASIKPYIGRLTRALS